MNSKRILNAIIANYPAKVISLLAALFLFFFHRTNMLDTRTLSIALQVENAGSMIPVNNYPKTIRVTFRGDRKLMDPITENDIEAFLDLLYCNTPGSYMLPVGLTKKGNALNVDPLEISSDPQVIRVELDEAASKTIPVKPAVTGSVPEGYELVQTQIAPSALLVNGPDALLKKTSALTTEPIKLDGQTENFSVTVRILNNEPLLELVGSKTAEFSASIRAVIPSRRYEARNIQVLNLRAGLAAHLKVEAVTVLVQAPREDLFELLNPESFVLTLDAAALTQPGVYTQPLHVALQLGEAGEAAALPLSGAVASASAPTSAEGAADSPAVAAGASGSVAGSNAGSNAGGVSLYTVVNISPEYVEVQISKED